jgi:hypothetical protein
MKTAACGECGAKTPLGSLYHVDGRILCEGCTERAVAPREDGEEPPRIAGRLLDPTLCAACGKDNGETSLPQVGGAPLCPLCEDRLRHFPFPVWVKLAAVLLLGLAVFAFARNWRFFKGYLEVQAANRAFEGGDTEEAGKLIVAAARRVPESRELAAHASFFQGLELMGKDRCAEAVRCFKTYLGAYPTDHNARTFLVHAEAGAAFHAKDYDTFLAKSRQVLAMAPDDSMSLAQVASALACKYAVTGQAQFKESALEYLGKATAIAGPNDAAAADYEARIRHRLDTREIIDREEYDRRIGAAKAEKGR